MTTLFDVIVLGAGPGGWVAATRAAQLGLKTACIDDREDGNGRPVPGGTCTNLGCIPSKALLASSEHFEQVQRHLGDHGIEMDGIRINIDKMLARKDAVVRKHSDGILKSLRENKVAFFHGRGSFLQPGAQGIHNIEVLGRTTQVIAAKYIVIATGSKPRALDQAPFDGLRILSSEDALRMGEVSRKIGVVGAGMIGLELGSVWRRLGADVTILERMPTLLGAADKQIAHEAQAHFEAQGLHFELGARLDSVDGSGALVTVEYETAANGTRRLEVDKLIVAIGRVPNTANLATEKIGLVIDEFGAIAVDDQCRTNVAGVWAIGDVVRGPMLAHKAEEEGAAVALRMAGREPEVNFGFIPWVVYTSPEIAWAGLTEQQLMASGRGYKTGIFPFEPGARTCAIQDAKGLTKVLADADTDEILGVHIIGPDASEMIVEAALAMEVRAGSRLMTAHSDM